MQSSRTPSPPSVLIWQTALATVIALVAVYAMTATSRAPNASILDVLVTRSSELAPYLVWIAVFALALWLGRRGRPAESPSLPPPLWKRAVLFLVAAALSFSTIAWFDGPARGLPPAYHDEYSYLFQSEQFLNILAGRPAHSRLLEWPEFEQMHVLSPGVRSVTPPSPGPTSQHVVASRYFPATGAWFAPFVLAGVPYLGGWILQALTCAFFALAASRWSMLAGVTTALLISASPAMIVFNSTFLSPGPTMLGLAIAWWGFQEAIIASRTIPAVLAGTAIGFAFLARPVTTVAIAFPWSLEAIFRWTKVGMLRRPVLAMILAFAPAPMLLAVYNHNLTGSLVVTPYGQWTAVFSPSHAYGFYNRTRGLQARTPRTIVAYDDWARELTPARAAELSTNRWRTAVSWMAGDFPLVLLGVLAILQIRSLGNAVLLPFSSTVLLTLAHVPFAFGGIFGFSYVVEATPFILLLASLAFARAFESWRANGRTAVAVAWSGIVVIPVVIAVAQTLPKMFSPPSEFMHPRIEMARRLGLENDLAKDGPILILYSLDRAGDLHAATVFNDPLLFGGILGRRVARAWKLEDSSLLLRQFSSDVAVYECTLSDGGRPQYRLVRPRQGQDQE